MALSTDTGGNGVSQQHGAADLGLTQMAAAVGVMLIAFLTSRYLDLRQDRNIAIATIRTILQLSALGYILLPIFRSNRPWVVLLWLLAMTLMAAREAVTRPKYTYRGMYLHAWMSVVAGLTVIMVFASILVLKQEPWWDAKIVIPISGMLLGNSMTAATLAFDRLLSDCSEGKERMELLLTRGATRFEAILPVVQAAVNVGITPTLNTMNVLGLVSLPGMMTGQILGGGLPVVAAKYQMMIMFLIAGNAICTMGCGLALAAYSVFDTRGRIRLQFVQKQQTKQKDLLLWLVSHLTSTLEAAWRLVRNRPSPTSHKGPAAPPEETTPLLLPSGKVQTQWKFEPPTTARFFSVDGLSHGFDRALLWQGLTFGLPRGGLLVITGPNGCGKSTLLQALCDLQPIGAGAVSLEGVRASATPPTEWRSRVVYLQQGHRLGQAGTPRKFLVQLSSLRAVKSQRRLDPSAAVQLADHWGMPPALWDQEWGTLSGGQVQHLHLAIALSTKADVLLLDEPTSACDPAAVSTLEAALRGHPATKVVITHDEEQAARLAADGGYRLTFDWAQGRVP